jgi:methyl-accepting chemotaxis protein
VLSIRELSSVLKITEAAIVTKYALIAEEIAKVGATSAAVALTIVVVIVVAAIMLSYLLARGIAISISLIGRNIAVISRGDLTCRFHLKRRDEIGALGANLDGFLESLNASLNRIQRASARNIELRDSLARSVSEATSSAVEIEANSDSIRGQMERMDRMIAQSSSEVELVASILRGFNSRLKEQDEHVEGSVAAVTQMLASISNISRIAEQDRRLAEDLVAEADQGREVFEDSFSRVAEIADSAGAIQDMVAVIEGIASKTNLLAMNAAIEAAHAGEFGKGFAVVSDEIGKLASASAESSAEIAQTIRLVIEKIKEADAAKGATSAAFESIAGRIKSVSDSVGEIYGNVSEIEIGSRQILESMDKLKASSKSIFGEAKQIEKSAMDTHVNIGDIGRVSGEVVSNIGEIALGLREISRTVQEVSGNAENIGQIGLDLDGSVNAFKTDDEGNC